MNNVKGKTYFLVLSAHVLLESSCWNVCVWLGVPGESNQEVLNKYKLRTVCSP